MVLLILFFPFTLLAQSLSSQVTFTVEQIVQDKVDLVDKKNQISLPSLGARGIFKPAESSNGVNLGSAVKCQQIALDLGAEGNGLRSSVISQQTSEGVADPQGCADVGRLNDNQKNQCTAATMLESMAIVVIEAQKEFKETADRSYETMEDVSAFPLDSSAVSNFATDSYGLPTKDSMIYESNKKTIDSFHQLFKSLDEKSEYKGLKFSTKNDYFYLDGKKYPTSVLMSREAMLKAGISQSIANFAFAMLNKKSKLAQNKIDVLLKKKKLFDGKNWTILKYGNRNNEQVESIRTENTRQLGIQTGRGNKALLSNQGSVDLSSSLGQETTLFRTVNGIPLGLSSDNIFKIISRKYREKDQMGFFHNSPKK